MTTQIRRSVFETNSSSSHSLTLGTAGLVAQPFSARQLREGVVEVSPGEYGWEYHRYYTAYEKIRYLLAQVLLGQERLSGEPVSITETLRSTNERVAMLCRVVRDHTGCELLITDTAGAIDHDSHGVGSELFNNEDSLRAFIFDETACVETSNDNSPGPWIVSTDRGDELYYSHLVRDIPKSYVAVELQGVGEYGVEALATADGGLVGPNHHRSLLARLGRFGVATSAAWACRGTYDRFEHHSGQEIAGHAVSEATRDESKALFKFSKDFTATSQYEVDSDYDNRQEVVTFTVYVPRALAADLRALPTDGVVRYRLSYAERQAAYWTTRHQESVAAGKSEAWSAKQSARFAKEVEVLRAKLH